MQEEEEKPAAGPLEAPTSTVTYTNLGCTRDGRRVKGTKRTLSYRPCGIPVKPLFPSQRQFKNLELPKWLTERPRNGPEEPQEPGEEGARRPLPAGAQPLAGRAQQNGHRLPTGSPRQKPSQANSRENCEQGKRLGCLCAPGPLRAAGTPSFPLPRFGSPGPGSWTRRGAGRACQSRGVLLLAAGCLKEGEVPVQSAPWSPGRAAALAEGLPSRPSALAFRPTHRTSPAAWLACSPLTGTERAAYFGEKENASLRAGSEEVEAPADWPLPCTAVSGSSRPGTAREEVEGRETGRADFAAPAARLCPESLGPGACRCPSRPCARPERGRRKVAVSERKRIERLELLGPRQLCVSLVFSAARVLRSTARLGVAAAHRSWRWRRLVFAVSIRNVH
ncbi:uncharacterized protein LOC110344883 [Heterocephalus glaber]|uniref:Uncharacterized protein LOC110344883 n=1 Tax=Heterocephalus glaber TaxID=10181 RepID=A0AAX6RG57_HETGA|nr:uncharacterized protein LOC110344883 [Heterocephalus glaber]